MKYKKINKKDIKNKSKIFFNYFEKLKFLIFKNFFKLFSHHLFFCYLILFCSFVSRSYATM
jgi:hypothetical protein